MQTRSAKRVRKEALTDSSPKKLLRSAYDARRKGLVASDRYTMQKSSAKRVRDQDQAECSNRPKFADREEIVPTAPSSEKKQKASERVKPAARSCKRPCSQSQAAGDTKAVLQKATSALQKKVDAGRPSDSPVHSEMEQLHSLSKQRKLRSKRKAEATSGQPKEENTVRPKNSSAQPEEEQLHPLSKRQKLGPEQEGKATSARPLAMHVLPADSITEAEYNQSWQSICDLWKQGDEASRRNAARLQKQIDTPLSEYIRKSMKGKGPYQIRGSDVWYCESSSSETESEGAQRLKAQRLKLPLRKERLEGAKRRKLPLRKERLVSGTDEYDSDAKFSVPSCLTGSDTSQPWSDTTWSHTSWSDTSHSSSETSKDEAESRRCDD